MKTSFLKTSFAIASFGLLLVGCTGESPTVIDNLKTSSADNTQASSISDDVTSTIDGFVNKAETTISLIAPESRGISSSTDTTTVNITVVKDTSISGYPKVVTIDFGTTGYTGKRGNVFKGKIIATVSGPMLIPGSKREVKYENFSVNDNALKGAKTITCVTPTSWNVVAKDTITRASDNEQITHNMDHTRTYVAAGTDSYFLITGSANGINGKGAAYTTEITTPLKVFVNYKHIVSGILTIKSGLKTATINYGDGTRDDQATVTVGLKTYDITLK